MKLVRKDWEWVLTCFGTAVGAGMLFLPIQAGLGGILPVFIFTAIIFPVTYVAHRGITRIVASCSTPTDIIGAIELDLGRNVGFAVSILYFLSIITICVGYATGITNITQSFLENQLSLTHVSRPLVTFLLLFSLTAVIMAGEKFMIRVTSLLTFPLIVFLFGLSLYLIPHWKMAVFSVPLVSEKVLKNILLTFPVLVFSMNFSPVCSVLASTYRRHFSDTEQAVARTDAVVKWTSLGLLFFVMFFVFSIILATLPEQLLQAKTDNVDVLTMLSLIVNEPILKYLIPVVAFLAIASSYFGHFIGTREGLTGIITRLMVWNRPQDYIYLNRKRINLVVSMVMVLGLWVLAVFNPPILKIIGALSAPIIAMYAYLMPVILMNKVPRLWIYRSRFAGFVFIMGLAVIVGDFVGSYL